MKDVIAGISENDLSNLCYEINKAAESIYEILKAIDNDFFEIKDCYKSKSLDLLMSSYSGFRKNYPIVKNNIESYSDDLSALIVKLKSGMLDLGNIFYEYTEGIKSKTKAINEGGINNGIRY